MPQIKRTLSNERAQSQKTWRQPLTAASILTYGGLYDEMPYHRQNAEIAQNLAGES